MSRLAQQHVPDSDELYATAASEQQLQPGAEPVHAQRAAVSRQYTHSRGPSGDYRIRVLAAL
jgi:hypothetical protein